MWDTLPQHILVRVLQHVDQGDRLWLAALVNSTWAAAAAMACDSMELHKRGARNEHPWDPSTFLPWLQRHGQYLTRLSCSDNGAWERYVFRTLPCTSNLRQLCMDSCAMQLGPSTEHPGILAAATGLTALDLCMDDQDDIVSTSASPAFSGCTGLRQLSLCSIAVHASAFKGLTTLRSLSVDVPRIEGGAAGVAAVLAHISHMQQLEVLHLGVGRGGFPVTLVGHDAVLSGVLTACVSLAHLDLIGVMVPPWMWVSWFGPGRQLPQLQSLRVGWLLDIGLGVSILDVELENLVTCCPGLTSLSWETLAAFQPGMCLRPLLQHLKQLECPRITDNAGSVGVLACMSALTGLTVHAGSGLTDAGLLQLTALTGLQESAIWAAGQGPCELSFKWSSRYCKTGLFFEATANRPSPWYQLLLTCAGSAQGQCHAALEQQLPRIMQQLQDSGYRTTAFELTRATGRARVDVVEAEAALAQANVRLAHAEVALQEGLL